MITVQLPNLLFYGENIVHIGQDRVSKIHKPATQLTAADFCCALMAFSTHTVACHTTTSSSWTRSVYTPSVYTHSVYISSIYTPSVYTPSIYTPSVYISSVYTPSVYISGAHHMAVATRNVACLFCYNLRKLDHIFGVLVFEERFEFHG